MSTGVRRTAACIIGAAALLTLPGCSRAIANRATGGAAQTCSDAQTFANVKAIIFDTAAKSAGEGNRLLVAELGRQSTFRISMAVLDSYDKVTQRTSCSGRAELTFPATAESAIGTAHATAEIRYTAQPSADAASTVYTVEGAGDLAAGIASANLAAWRATTPEPATAAGGPQSGLRSATTAELGQKSAPAPTAAELLQGDPQLQARERRLQGLYQNALERDATGQVRSEQETALGMRNRCRTKTCLSAWYDRRESTLKAWDGN